MLAEIGYRGYGLTYRATYNILYGECATGIANQASFSFSFDIFPLYLNTAVDKDSGQIILLQCLLVVSLLTS